MCFGWYFQCYTPACEGHPRSTSPQLLPVWWVWKWYGNGWGEAVKLSYSGRQETRLPAELTCHSSHPCHISRFPVCVDLCLAPESVLLACLSTPCHCRRKYYGLIITCDARGREISPCFSSSKLSRLFVIYCSSSWILGTTCWMPQKTLFGYLLEMR